MGKVKAMAMDLEDEFFEMCAILAAECCDYEEYSDKMCVHIDMVKHMDSKEIEYAMVDIWNEQQLDAI